MLWNILYKCGCYKQGSEKNSVETIVGNRGIMWSDKRHIEEGLDHKNLLVTTGKYFSHHKKYKYELVDKLKKTTKQNFYRQKIN